MEQTLRKLSDIDKYVLARWCYSIGQPVMDDTTYNQLRDLLESVLPDNEYVKRSWSDDPCPVALLKSIGRDDLIRRVVLSDKTESIPTLNTEAELLSALGDISGDATLSMKLDGWNLQANYYNGHIVNLQTRGRSTDAMDVSALEKYIPSRIPYMKSCKIVMELTVSKEEFKKCAKLFGNVSPRNAVPTVLSRSDYHTMLSFTAFDIHGVDLGGECKFEALRRIGYDVPLYQKVNTYYDLWEAMRYLSNAESTYSEPTDGMVYDGTMRRAIRLLAWEEPIYQSYVTGYLEKYGPNRISPSVLIRPVLRKGSTQHQLSMTNWQRIIDYNLQRGAPIAFRIASSATADFNEEVTQMLHTKWKGRWSEYKQKVDNDEEVRRCQHEMYLNS